MLFDNTTSTVVQTIASTGGLITFNTLSFGSTGTTAYFVQDLFDFNPTKFFNVVVVAQPIAPVLDKTPNTASICDGVNVHATLNTAGSGGAGCNDSYQYQRKTGGIWSSWQTYTLGADISTTGYTDVAIRALTSSSGTGCYAERIYSWIITKVTATASNNGPLCAGETLNLYGGGGVSYSWKDPSNTVFSTDQNPTITNVTTANAGIYTVTVTDANGCIDSETTTVVVNSLPAAPTAGNYNAPYDALPHTGTATPPGKLCGTVYDRNRKHRYSGSFRNQCGHLHGLG